MRHHMSLQPVRLRKHFPAALAFELPRGLREVVSVPLEKETGSKGTDMREKLAYVVKDETIRKQTHLDVIRHVAPQPLLAHELLTTYSALFRFLPRAVDMRNVLGKVPLALRDDRRVHTLDETRSQWKLGQSEERSERR